MKKSYELFSRKRMFAPFAALLILFLFASMSGELHAQTPLDEQLNRVVSVLNTLLTPPCTTPPGTAPRECARVTKNFGVVNVSNDRTVNQARERTSISVLAAVTEAGAQEAFQQKAKFYGDPANNVFHGTLLTIDKFAVGSGPTQDAVLQVSLSPNDSQQGDAIGYMVCGNLGLELSMTLFHPSATGVTGQQAVSNTQRELKTLMQKIASALTNAGACSPGASPQATRGLSALEPALATISEVDGVSVDVKRYSKFIPNPNDWERGRGPGRELHFGDTFCFRGRGTVKLKWYDGSIISFNDPNVGKERGQYTHCFEINLRRPNDIPAPGVLPRAGQFIIDYVSNLGGFVRMVVQAVKPPPSDEPEGRFRASTHSVVLAVKGTSWIMGQGAQGTDLICVEEGVVEVTPRNSATGATDVKQGEQVQVTANSVGAITAGCTIPPAVSLPQPNTRVTRMTIQAARQLVFGGDTIRVPVWLIKAQNLANLNFELAYDPSVIQIAGDARKGNLLDNALFKANPNAAGQILVGLAQTTPIQNDVGTLIEIPFRVVGKPGDVSPLLLNVTTINDPNGGVLEIDRIPGEIVIVNNDGSFPPIDGTGAGGGGAGGAGGAGGGAGGIEKGDCDGTGAVNELDALCALEMSTGLRTTRLIVDMDADGNVTSRDAVIILQNAVGQ